MAKYYQKHIYDVDIISTYLKFKKGLNNGSLEFSDGLSTKEFLARLQTSIEETTKNDQGSVKKLIEFEIPTVITHDQIPGQFNFWFALQLMVTDHNRIPLMLNEHLRNWSDKVAFINLVEFDIALTFDINKPNDIDKNTEAVYSWINSVREKYGYELKKESASEILNSKKRDAKEDDVLGDINFKNIHLPALKKLVSNQLAVKSQKDELDILLQGKKINTPIKIKCSPKVFTFIFIELKDKKKIVETKLKIAEWLCKNFLFKLKPHNPFTQRSYNRMRILIYGQDPPVTEDRIDISSVLEPK